MSDDLVAPMPHDWTPLLIVGSHMMHALMGYHPGRWMLLCGDSVVTARVAMTCWRWRHLLRPDCPVCRRVTSFNGRWFDASACGSLLDMVPYVTLCVQCWRMMVSHPRPVFHDPAAIARPMAIPDLTRAWWRLTCLQCFTPFCHFAPETLCGTCRPPAMVIDDEEGCDAASSTSYGELHTSLHPEGCERPFQWEEFE